ncbi:hypothetical protein [Bacteroides fluxus]|uniref:hypothetical protein n=1 Tax=Bacteroides fluxus TaxID=626930 RepID=UPI002A83F5BE|nr:hypothetical protein [Bacteroides fluxus]MDY3790574.1 hypothetical protein [Bacteroides fluxus]
MSVNYSLALMSSKPGDDTAPKLYYAKAQAAGEAPLPDDGGNTGGGGSDGDENDNLLG